MIPGPARRKGGEPLLGVIPGTEDVGPFGRYLDGEDDDGPDDGGQEPPVPPPADDRVAAQVADAAARRERRARERQERQQRRRAGLAQRHAAKLRALAERDRQTQPEPPDAA